MKVYLDSNNSGGQNCQMNNKNTSIITLLINEPNQILVFGCNRVGLRPCAKLQIEKTSISYCTELHYRQVGILTRRHRLHPVAEHVAIKSQSHQGCKATLWAYIPHNTYTMLDQYIPRMSHVWQQLSPQLQLVTVNLGRNNIFSQLLYEYYVLIRAVWVAWLWLWHRSYLV